jgi:hypothetical protein
MAAPPARSSPSASRRASPNAIGLCRVHDLVSNYGLFGTLDREHFYQTIDEAIAAIEGDTEQGAAS